MPTTHPISHLFTGGRECPIGDCSLIREVLSEIASTERRLVDRTVAEHEQTRHSLDRIEQGQSDLHKAISTVESRLDWVESAGEQTLAETAKAKAKQVMQEAKLSIHDELLSEQALAAARAAGAEAASPARSNARQAKWAAFAIVAAEIARAIWGAVQ